MQACKFKDDVE